MGPVSGNILGLEAAGMPEKGDKWAKDEKEKEKKFHSKETAQVQKSLLL